MNREKNCKDSAGMYREEVLLWSVASMQHIELLIGTKKIFGVSLSDNIRCQLDELICSFTKIKEYSGCYKKDTGSLIRDFLRTNAKFIKLINCIMFEEYLNNTELFEIVNHFMIEQIYASRVFTEIKRSTKYKDEKFVLGPDFYTKEGLGDSKEAVLHNTFYFWNIISAQHCSILENILKYYNCKMCRELWSSFKNLKRACLNYNKRLSRAYDDSIISGFKSMCRDMLEFEEKYLDFLYSLTPVEVGRVLPENTPEIFFEFKEHVIEEQEYIHEKLKKLILII